MFAVNHTILKKVCAWFLAFKNHSPPEIVLHWRRKATSFGNMQTKGTKTILIWPVYKFTVGKLISRSWQC